MNREIKFRIWDSDDEEWLNEDDYIGINNFGVVVNDRDSMDDLSLCDNCIIQQFTGIKCKNDKEIYEGDILLNENNTKFIVEYSNGAFMCKYLHNNSYVSCYFTGSHYQLKVIGNILQNPELLN